MIRNLLTIILIVNCALTSAQFTYLNQITGEFGDLSSEVCSNVVVSEDGYVIWGAEIDDNVLIHFIRRYNFQGEIINTHENIFNGEYLYSGITNSFQWNPYTQAFVMLQGSDLGDTVEGRMLTFNENLQLQNNLYFNDYDPYTYFFGYLTEPDGYVILGENASVLHSQGTFIMKLDFEGNVLWSEIMQPEIYQNIYRNWSILKTDEGYLIAGGGRTPESDHKPFGLITQTNNLGITQSETVVEDENALQSGFLGAVGLLSGEILMGQTLAYELVNPNGNPDIFWLKTRLFKYNPETGAMYDMHTYFDNYEMKMGGPIDMVATADGGAVLLGNRSGFFYDSYAWMMKVDADLNQEWFHEYTYQTCDNCGNKLSDLELTPDGGYVAAGTFANWDIDPRNVTWLLKVDACGDVEWQGCEAVGVAEQEAQSFSVYPNPSSGRFTIEASENENISAWSVYNLAGQIVAQGNTQVGGESLEISLNLPSGLYALELVQTDGTRENHKIQIVK